MFELDVQVVGAEMARALHQGACRDHALVAWIVSCDDPAFPDRFMARLATNGALPHVLVGETLAAVQEQLPDGLTRLVRQPADPPEVVQIWLTPPQSGRGRGSIWTSRAFQHPAHQSYP